MLTLYKYLVYLKPNMLLYSNVEARYLALRISNSVTQTLKGKKLTPRKCSIEVVIDFLAKLRKLSNFEGLLLASRVRTN